VVKSWKESQSATPKHRPNDPTSESRVELAQSFHTEQGVGRHGAQIALERTTGRLRHASNTIY
jgi:hypothetical protein